MRYPCVTLCLCLWVFVTSLDSEGRCPHPCRCEGTLRYCDKAGLITVPQDLIGSSGLSLRDNRLLCLPQGALSRFNTLQWLFLGHNQIQRLDERAFLGLRRLKELELSANQLWLLPNRTFWPLPNLRLLDLSTNQVSALSSSQFRGLRKLMVLRLRRNLLVSVPVRVFQDLRKLRVLDLGENRLQTLARNAFVGLLSLTELRLDQNRLNRVNLGLFARLTSLRSLDLSQNKAAWLGRTLHWNWPTLEHLDLSRNRLEWVEPTAFYGVPRLKSLLLNSNRLQVLERNILQNWVSLENLTLSGNPWDCGRNICALATWLGRYRGRRDNALCSLPEEAEGENILDAVYAFQTCQSHVFGFNTETNITVEINTNTETDNTVGTDTDTVVIATVTEWYIVTETMEHVLKEENKEEEEEEEQYSAAEPFTVTPDVHPQKRHLAMERTIVVSTATLLFLTVFILTWKCLVSRVKLQQQAHTQPKTEQQTTVPVQAYYINYSSQNAPQAFLSRQGYGTCTCHITQKYCECVV